MRLLRQLCDIDFKWRLISFAAIAALATTPCSALAISWGASNPGNLLNPSSWAGGVVPFGTDAVATIGTFPSPGPPTLSGSFSIPPSFGLVLGTLEYKSSVPRSLEGGGLIMSSSGTAQIIQAAAPLIINAEHVVLDSNTEFSIQGVFPFLPSVVVAPISGNGRLIKTGPGTLVITNDLNDYTGGTDIQGGTLVGGTITDFGVSSTYGTGHLSISNGGTLEYAGATASTNRTLSLGSGGGIIAVNDAAAVLTLTSDISGTSSLTKVGNGALSLGDVTSLAGLYVQSGRLSTNYVGIATNGENAQAVVSGASTEMESYFVNVGGTGNGSLTIEGGAHMEVIAPYSGALTIRSIVGDLANPGPHGTGQVVVQGANSSLAATDMHVHSSGNLLIRDGGSVTTPYGSIGIYADPHGGTVASVTVEGAGSLWSVDNYLSLGFFDGAEGSLQVESGGQVKTFNLGIGGYGMSGSSVQVRGPGSKLEADYLTLGSELEGSTLSIEDGGFVLSGTTSLGSSMPSSFPSIANVSDSNSHWQITGELNVGRAGPAELNVVDGSVEAASLLITKGKMTISAGIVSSGQYIRVGLDSGNDGAVLIDNGGQLSNTIGTIGYWSGSTGQVTVDGADSNWTNSSTLNVGLNGNGALSILRGGQVANAAGYIGRYATESVFSSMGSVSVSDLGSLWENSTTLHVGGNSTEKGGSGLLTVSNGGTVTVGQRMHVWDTGTVDVSGRGNVQIGAMIAPMDGAVVVGEGGVLSGTGTIIGNVANIAGIVAPGASPGALTIEGDYAQGPFGLLSLEIGGLTGSTTYDQLFVTGNIAAEGAISIAFMNGFEPQSGDHFDLLFAHGTFDISGVTLQFANVPAGMSFETTFSAGTFTLTAVPEPGGWLLAGTCGVLGLIYSRQLSRRVPCHCRARTTHQSISYTVPCSLGRSHNADFESTEVSSG